MKENVEMTVGKKKKSRDWRMESREQWGVNWRITMSGFRQLKTKTEAE